MGVINQLVKRMIVRGRQIRRSDVAIYTLGKPVKTC